MNEVDVEDVVINILGAAEVGDGALDLGKGIFGRDVQLGIGGSVRIPTFGVTITLEASESARERAKFGLNLESPNSMEPI
jgi:hypothetical protein